MDKKFISIEVVYANKDTQWIIPLNVPSSSTIIQTLQFSGILQQCAEIDLTQQKVGIFGVIKSLDTVVQEYDRIEIYRPIIIDPMLQRQQRVKANRKKHAK